MDRLIKLLQREIESIEHTILNGQCPDFLTYQTQLARRSALFVAIDIVKRAYIAEDDDEEDGS